ncbi:MAG: hybrid sensor histidine kinase/response regulator [Deltaproteobacteria bacterium]|nr:MAG: hybrid sensor histidine kinase/response regulator [Deltaproteobacteria bacterium]
MTPAPGPTSMRPVQAMARLRPREERPCGQDVDEGGRTGPPCAQRASRKRPARSFPGSRPDARLRAARPTGPHATRTFIDGRTGTPAASAHPLHRGQPGKSGTRPQRPGSARIRRSRGFRWHRRDRPRHLGAPDLILCDIEMPGIDGYETATRLRSYRGLDGCPIVVLTSHGDRGLSLSIGCDGYIEKPIDVEKFPGQLREFLKGKREKVKTAEERRYLREYSQSLVERLEATVRELTAANSRLRAAARSKTEFMQNLSHELATPLTPITGYLKILKSEKTGALTEPQRKILDSMQTASERLSRTIDNLVDFATLESGGYAIHRDTFDPRAAAKSVLDEEKPKAKARRITLELSVDSLPETGWGDERKLKQALGNVIDNAIKFSPHGSHVLVRVASDSQQLSFEVYDQGEGMLADEAEKVFDPFFHADRVGEERAPGAGLGLPVAKQIIEAHGGRISAESPPKNQPDSKAHFSGTKLSFWIPLRAFAPKEPHPTPFHESAPEGGTS